MAFLAFGTTWFWVVFLVSCIIMTIVTERGQGIGATFTLGVTLALLYTFGSSVQLVAFFGYCFNHPWNILGLIIVYFVIGVCWSILKWYSFLIKKREEDAAELEKYSIYIKAPRASEHKEKILVWMIYWPFLLIWNIIDMPVRHIFQFIFRFISGKFQFMSDRIYAPLIYKSTKKCSTEQVKCDNV